ncbi:hypothetical protein OGATHE_004218 [Ogataea polymorpha]|uniref:Acid phosphatase n=1 Tax=Ogataea polymorpha TaxID=460523 RepID=A0A9P8T1C0_9ASCO|nr:hypothetical protein OGATHE_004218 [Ogataea polymorpha]
MIFKFFFLVAYFAFSAEASILSPPYPQTSTDQSNVLRYLNGGPFVENTGFGLPLDPPYGCKIEQVQLFMRHGERYPTKSAGKTFETLYQKLKNDTVTSYSGPLAFVKDLEYFVNDPENYEMESTKGVYSGLLEAYRLGAFFRERYESLLDSSSVVPIFAASQQRVVDTARSFGKGLFLDQYNSSCSIQIINEVGKMNGANTLTPITNCLSYNTSLYQHTFGENIYQAEAERLNALSPGFNITPDDIFTMGAYCGYELNVKGKSDMCQALSMDAFQALQYQDDLQKFYQFGPGHNMSAVSGGLLANASAQLLQEDRKVVFSFMHDNDLLTYFTALGLPTDTELSTEEIEFHRSFKTSEFIPQGARLIIEKLNCSDSENVRFIVNDKVYPLPGCSSGPGFTCPLEETIELLTPEHEYAEACGLPDDRPHELTFYWDWEPTFTDN